MGGGVEEGGVEPGPFFFEGSMRIYSQACCASVGQLGAGIGKFSSTSFFQRELSDPLPRTGNAQRVRPRIHRAEREAGGASEEVVVVRDVLDAECDPPGMGLVSDAGIESVETRKQ
jgi:hypothetical protein